VGVRRLPGFGGDGPPNTAALGFGGLVPGYVAGVDGDPALQALIRAYIACRLAVEALPDLPEDVRREVSTPVTVLCNTVGPALEKVDPGFLDRANGRR